MKETVSSERYVSISRRPTARCHLVAFALVSAACARHRGELRPPLEIIKLAAPPCGPGGPSVEIVEAIQMRCRKAETCLVLDERIRNPTDRTLWFPLDDRREFTGYVKWVELETRSPATQPVVWVLAGSGLHELVRVPPGADVILREVDYSGVFSVLKATFLDRITIGDRLLDEIDRGILPKRGEIDVSLRIQGAIDREQPFRVEGKEVVAADAWCVQDVAVPDELHR